MIRSRMIGNRVYKMECNDGNELRGNAIEGNEYRTENRNKGECE